MGTDSSGKLFYGFLIPSRENEDNDGYFGGHYDLDEEHKCTVGILGYDENLIEFVCVKESLNVVEWDKTKIIESFNVGSEWSRKIQQYCEELGIPYQKPRWILGCLYF